MKFINDGIQLLQDDNTYTISADVEILAQAGTGLPTPDDEDNNNIFPSVTMNTGGGYDNAIEFHYNGRIETDSEYWDFNTTSNYAKVLEIKKSGKLTISMIFQAGWTIGGLTSVPKSYSVGYTIDRTFDLNEAFSSDLKASNPPDVVKGDIQYIHPSFPVPTPFETYSHDVTFPTIDVIAGDKIKFYGTKDNASIYAAGVFFNFGSISLDYFIDESDIHRDMNVNLVKAESNWNGVNSLYNIIDTEVITSSGTKNITLTSSLTLPEFDDRDTLYIMTQMVGDPIANHTIKEVNWNITSPYRIDKRVFAELTNLDETYIYDDEYELGSFSNPSGNISRSYDINIPSGRENDGLKLRIYGVNGQSLNTSQNDNLPEDQKDRLTLSNVELNIQRFTQ